MKLEEDLQELKYSIFMDEFEYENHVWCVGERTQHYGNLQTSKG